MHSEIWNTRTYQNRIDFSFALVVEEVAGFRNSVMALLRERGWLVHGTNCAEEALRLLAHIPHNPIVLDLELPGMGGIDFVHMLQNAMEWREIGVVVVAGSRSPSLRVRWGKSGHFWQANQAGKSIFLNS